MNYVREGDEKPAATALINRGGVAVDLTNATSVTFKMRPQRTTTWTVEAAATINDATAGDVEYRWAAGDTDTAGIHEALWVVLWNDGDVETFPTLGYDYVLVEGT